jgi:pimeloyl-ACP methyl ester carboxylesterase
MRRIRGLANLVFDTVVDTTSLVERTHVAVATRSVRRFAPIEPVLTPARAVNDLHLLGAAGVYASIRAVSRGIQTLVGAGTAALKLALPEEALPPPPATPLRSDAVGSLAWLVDHAESAVNGFIGDRLSRRRNGLDLGMTLRHDGHVLPVTREALGAALPAGTRKLCVFVHGLSCTEWAWSAFAERFHGDPKVTFGSLLQQECGYTPLYVRYNSGRHISENGRLLSELLNDLAREYPAGVSEIVLVGHSMGGLVARSAAHYAAAGELAWSKHLRHVFCIGSPHLGAPLEQAVHLGSHLLRALPTAGTQVPAEILDARSVGIKDLRFGYTLDEEWQNADPNAPFADNRSTAALVDGVGYYFLAACLTRDPSHPLGQLLGDLLVRLPSACGDCPEQARRIRFRSGKVFGGMHHFDLANHPDVYAVIRSCLEADTGTKQELSALLEESGVEAAVE